MGQSARSTLIRLNCLVKIIHLPLPNHVAISERERRLGGIVDKATGRLSMSLDEYSRRQSVAGGD